MKEDWEYKKLEGVCTKGSSNISLNKIESNVGDYSLFGASGFVKGIDFFHQSTPYIGIVKDGSGVGRVDIYPAKSSLVGTMQYILPKKGCELGFLKYLLQGLHLEKYKTGAAIPHIYFKDYGKCKVPIPPLSEQQQIVEELDLLSSIIEKKKEQLKELDALAQSIFYDMFGDPVTNEKGWEMKKIGELALVKTGPFGSMLHKDDYISNGTPLVNPIHMKNFHIVADMDFTISDDKVKELDNYILQENDVIFARRGDIGRCAVVSNKENGYLCGTGSLFVRFESNIYPSFVMFVIRSDSFTKELILNARGVTMLNLNSNVISNLTIPLPPLSLQQQFASKIEAIEHQKELIKQSVKEAETLFNSRMDYYFN